MAKAEGISAPYVEARKQYETRMRQIKVWRSLAANKELVVSGESNEELNTLMLCDAIMEGNPVGGETKSQAGLTLRVPGLTRGCLAASAYSPSSPPALPSFPTIILSPSFPTIFPTILPLSFPSILP